MPLTANDRVERGDRLVCVKGGSTPLIDGSVYTVEDVQLALLDVEQLVMLVELPGMLFGAWRFERFTL